MRSIAFFLTPPLRPALLALVCALGLGACAGEKGASSLNAEEQSLVLELVELYEAELLSRARGEELADPLSGAQIAELEARIGAQGRDPARAALVLRAVHDSLVAFRDELVAAATEGVE